MAYVFTGLNDSYINVGEWLCVGALVSGAAWAFCYAIISCFARDAPSDKRIAKYVSFSALLVAAISFAATVVLQRFVQMKVSCLTGELAPDAYNDTISDVAGFSGAVWITLTITVVFAAMHRLCDHASVMESSRLWWYDISSSTNTLIGFACFCAFVFWSWRLLFFNHIHLDRCQEAIRFPAGVNQSYLSIIAGRCTKLLEASELGCGTPICMATSDSEAYATGDATTLVGVTQTLPSFLYVGGSADTGSVMFLITTAVIAFSSWSVDTEYAPLLPNTAGARKFVASRVWTCVFAIVFVWYGYYLTNAFALSISAVIIPAFEPAMHAAVLVTGAYYLTLVASGGGCLLVWSDVAERLYKCFVWTERGGGGEPTTADRIGLLVKATAATISIVGILLLVVPLCLYDNATSGGAATAENTRAVLGVGWGLAFLLASAIQFASFTPDVMGPDGGVV